MPAQPAIPPLLSQYLTPPDGSLTLLTGTLGATTNWLILRFLTTLTATQGSSRFDAEATARSAPANTHIILLSWLRNTAFWKDGGRKLSIDFQRTTIIDALSHSIGLGADGLAAVETQVKQTIAASYPGKPICLILDGLDFLLAATTHETHVLLDMVYELRSVVSQVIVTANADAPLLQAQTTALEVNGAALMMNLAHQASLVMSLRELETGGAKDVSGILRITGGGGGLDDDVGGVEEKECLYCVGTDGGVRVFDRGA